MRMNKKHQEQFDNDEEYQKLRLDWHNKTRDYLIINFKKEMPASTSDKELEAEKEMLSAEYELKKYMASQLSYNEFKEIERLNNKMNSLESLNNELGKVGGV